MGDLYIIDLNHADALQTSLVGGKAAGLATLRRAGFPAPDGLCLTTAALELALDQAAGILPSENEIPVAPPVPEVVLNELRQMLPAVVDHPLSPLAVRSSATLEDGQDRSYAGVFSTALGVHGEKGLIEAIKDCWLSFLKFKTERDYPQGHGMAVLIQPLIEAECAGVCFSIDPIQGDRQQMIVSAAWGLGLGVVDGSVANDSYWIVRERLRPIGRQIALKEKQISPDPEGGVQKTPVADERRRAACLPNAWLGRIAQYAIAAETLFGRAQDMEWAIAGNEFWLLQSRPITGLPAEVCETPPFPISWHDEQDRLRAWEPYPLAGHERDVLLPLERDCLAALENQREETCRFIGADRNGRLAFFYGRPYFCSLPMTLPPADLRIRRQAMDDLQSRLQQQNLTAWDYWGPEIVKAVERLRAFNLAAAGGQALAEHLEEALAVRLRHARLHPIMWFKPGAAYFEAYAALSGLEASRVEAAAYRLVEGEENILTKLVDDLFALAETARKSPVVGSLVTESAPDVIGRLEGLAGPDRTVAQDFLAQLEAFMAGYGERNGNGYGSVATICTPTWGEEPALVLHQVAAYLDPALESPATARRRARQAREAEIEALCQASQNEAIVSEFRRQLAYARKAYTVLEEHNHTIDQLGVGQLRRAILAGGRYLVGQNVLSELDDVFWLHYDELLAALRAEGSGLMKQEIDGRKTKQATWQALEPPTFLGLPLARLPERPPLEQEAVSPRAQEGNRLEGLGASPGRYRGRAKVMHDRLSMPDISPGDILVAPNAGPLWTPIFPLLGGLILDGGSLGQHAAVTAREYGLPAVIGTRMATHQIPDGAWVTIDGAAGTVEFDAGEED